MLTANKWRNRVERVREEILVGWEPTLVGWIALNMDGASRRNPGVSGGGGIFRGWHGECLGGFAERMGVYYSARAELRAVLRGLLVAKEKDFKKLLVNVDSMLVVGMLKGSLLCYARHHAMSRDVRGYSSPWIGK